MDMATLSSLLEKVEQTLAYQRRMLEARGEFGGRPAVLDAWHEQIQTLHCQLLPYGGWFAAPGQAGLQEFNAHVKLTSALADLASYHQQILLKRGSVAQKEATLQLTATALKALTELMKYVPRSAAVKHSPPLVVVPKRPTHADLAIVTAMSEELQPVLQLAGGEEHWHSFVISGFLHRHTQLALDARSISVVVCSQSVYGGEGTVAALHRLEQIQPGLVAMTGICAGRENSTHLGDVIVAEHAFGGDEGKRTSEGLQADVRTYGPPEDLLGMLKDFENDKQWHISLKTPRPISLRFQAEWVLCRSIARDSVNPQDGDDWLTLKQQKIEWKRVREWLIKRGWITQEAGCLTEMGRRAREELRQANYGMCEPTADPEMPNCYVRPFASVTPIVADDDPFFEYQRHVRKVSAIDLEIKALFKEAANLHMPAFAVKGISDYGTPEKDDAFHEYAAETAARWMYAFINRYSEVLFQ
jgi:nucleoside phosphorylase